MSTLRLTHCLFSVADFSPLLSVKSLNRNQPNRKGYLNKEYYLETKIPIFISYFPEHAEFHVIKPDDPCWLEMELEEKLKFVDP